MNTNNLAIALAYYKAMAEKNIAGLEKYLHADVRLISPFAVTTDKEAVLEAAKGFVTIFKTLTIRAKCSSEDQVMLALDLECPAPIGKLRTAVLMTLKDGLIIENELFFDTRYFDKK